MNRATYSADFGIDMQPHGLHQGLHASRDIKSLLSAVRRHAGKLALWVAVLLTIAAIYIVKTAPEYVASTLVLFELQRPASGVAAELDVLDAAQADSRLQIIRSERLLRFVFDTLNLGSTAGFQAPAPSWRQTLMGRVFPRRPETPERVAAEAFLAFIDRVNVRRVGQSYVIEVSYRALDPIVATRTVNSITSAFIWDRIVSAQRGSEYLQNRVVIVKAEEEAALAGVRDGIIPDARFPDADARVISAAIEPTAKSSPQSTLIILFALAFGLTTGLGAIVLVHAFDRRIRTRRDLERNFDVVCLTVLPALSGRQRRYTRHGQGLAKVDPSYADALRSLRAVMIPSNLDANHRSVGVVSWHNGAGKTTVASCLAQVIAAASEPVVLVDADLRHPDLTQGLAPHEKRGLTESLLARDPLANLTRRQLSNHLCFVPAVGEETGMNLDAFLGLPEMRKIVADLQHHASVIIDLPALSRSSDAQAVGQMLDGVIIVVEAGRTTFDEVGDALAALRSAHTGVLGVVLNRAVKS